MTATDKTFTHGQVGFGTFDDTANFDDFKLYGVKHAARPDADEGIARIE